MADMNSESTRIKFMDAVDNDHIDVVEDYLQKGLNPNFEGDPVYNAIWNTPLMIASHLQSISHYKMIQLLLKYGADPNYTNDTGSVLHWTIYDGPSFYEIDDAQIDAITDPVMRQQVIEAYERIGIRNNPQRASESLIYLLENGANPFIRDELGDTPYDICMTRPNIHVSNTLMLKKFMDIIRIQRCYRRKMTRKRVKTIKSERRLALMKCMEFREGPLDTIRYDPSILERISKFI
jgi:ankyrin repeat protein